VFTSLSHKCPSSRLGKHDETGMTLMHHAAVYNRPHVITVLVQLGQDVNIRKISSVFAAGWSCLVLSVMYTAWAIETLPLIFYDYFGKCKLILIILSLLHSEINSGRYCRNKSYHIASNLLPYHYLVKVECSTVQLFICTCILCL